MKRAFILLLLCFGLVLPPVACGGGGGGSTQPAPPASTYTATFTAGTGVSMGQTAYTFPSGGTGTFTFAVSPGYQNPVVQKLSGTGSATLTSATSGTFTGTSDLTFTISATAVPPATYTATFVVGSSVSMPQTVYSYPSGGTGTFTFAVSPGYQNPVVQKLSGTGSATLTSATGGTFTGTSDLTFSITASAIPPPTYTATFTVGTGVSMAQAVYTYASGATTPFSFTVTAGYQNPVATVTSGTGSVALTGAASGTFTGTSNLAIVISATAIPKGAIAFVVSPDIISAIRPLIDTYMAAVAADTGCTSILIENTATPAVIRTQLKAITNLKCALLIGNIPIVKRQRGLAYEVSNNIMVAHEHYYRALGFAFKDPVLDSDGYYRLPDEYRFDNWEPFLPSFSMSISIGRIMGPSKDTMISDVRSYIEKNLRLRNTGLTLPQTLSYIEAFDFHGTYDASAVRAAYANHPFGTFALSYDITGSTGKAAFLAALGNSSYVRVSSHGGVNGLNFNGTSYFDSRSETPLTSQARYIHIDSCGAGDIGFFVAPYTYLVGESMATRLLTSGDTLLVSAANESIASVSYASIYHAYHNDFSLGVGRRFYAIEKYGGLYKHEMAYFGDPTIAMKKPDPMITPKIVISCISLSEEGEVPLLASEVSGENKYCDVLIKNDGVSELEVRGNVMPDYTTSASVDRGSSGRWWVTGYDSIVAITHGAIKILPGTSKTLRITLYKRDHGGNVATGTHEGYFHFSCNDPKVGAFRISVKGTLQ